MLSDLLAQTLNLPDSWVIFDVKIKNNELWLSLKPKETSLSDDLETEILRHLEAFGRKAYIKLYFSDKKDLNKLPFYTTTGFCKLFLADVRKMFGRATDESICNLYSLTKKELNKIKEGCKTLLE